MSTSTLHSYMSQKENSKRGGCIRACIGAQGVMKDDSYSSRGPFGCLRLLHVLRDLRRGPPERRSRLPLGTHVGGLLKEGHFFEFPTKKGQVFWGLY